MNSSYLQRADTERLKQIALLCYLLQAGSFLFGITLLVALIIGYIKRSDARGTWLESHYRWQIRTFWWTLLWSLVAGVTTLLLVGYAIIPIVVIWFIYRIARGWLALIDGKPLPM